MPRRGRRGFLCVGLSIALGGSLSPPLAASEAELAAVHSIGRLASGSCGPARADQVLAVQIGRTRSLALKRLEAATVGRTDRFPESAAPAAKSWTRKPATAWTSGFFPGSLWQAYEWTRDPAWSARAGTWTAGVRAQARNTGTHDLGFVIGSSVGRGAQLSPSPSARTSYSRTILTAARSLVTRWNPRVGAIQSGAYDGQWGVIVDSAMNMQLLFQAAWMTKDPQEAESFRRIAQEHLITVAQNFVRADGSTVHRISYDPVAGKRLAVLPGQGHTETSTWSRGQAWAIYGFTAGYRQTRDERLLAAARRVADFWLARSQHECIPRWDFDAPASMPQKDSSAGAIAAAGLLDLARLDPDRSLSAAYRSHALALVGQLTSRNYTTLGTAHPAILRRQSYSIPESATEGSYIWGDHYLLEAMTKAVRVLRVRPRLALGSPTTSYAGQTRVVASAALPGGAPARGVPIRLEWRPNASTTWRTIAFGVTSATGRTALRYTPARRGMLRAVSDRLVQADLPVAGYTAARSGVRPLEVTSAR